MRSKIIPGRVRPISYLPLVLIVIVTTVCTSFIFNWLVDVQLERLENANRSTQIEPYTVVTEEAETLYLANEYERDMVESVVMAEAGNQGLEGMEAVAQVILDRSTLWDMTATEVVTQPGQFANMYQGEVSEECRLAVSNVFDLGVRIFPENVTHFYSGDVEPYWAEDKECRGILRDHKFYM